MPLLSLKEKELIYQDWLSTRTKNGKWIKLVRIPGNMGKVDNFADPTHTFVAFNEDARWLHLWLGFSVLEEDDHIKVQFGSVRLFDVWAKAEANKFRVIVVDCSL